MSFPEIDACPEEDEEIIPEGAKGAAKVCEAPRASTTNARRIEGEVGGESHVTLHSRFNPTRATMGNDGGRSAQS